MYTQALALWQHEVCKKLASESLWLKKEIEIIKQFWNIKYVYETDVADLEDKWIKDRTLRRKSLKEYRWEIPKEHIDILVKARQLKIFDDIIILYTRKKTKELELDKKKKKSNSNKKRKVDPIAFRVINSTDRLYVLCDWEDEECDLTVKKLDKEINIEVLK